MRACVLLTILFSLFTFPNELKAAPPNILWITSEDNSPYLGCYGDPQAITPNLDALAARGVRYRNVHANAPVCSPARTALITGMYPNSLGAGNHRSQVTMPAAFQYLPEILRAEGYYCTNNKKTDYNVIVERQIWDESSAEAHYKKRAPGQPFFAVFNLGITHESLVSPMPKKVVFNVQPADVILPPYFPDTLPIRRDLANYYDQMKRMDEQARALLDELETLGDSENTIVFYFSDHGGPLARGKRDIHETGTRVPLIISFPEQLAHLEPASPGEWVNDMISLVDLPKTVLNLCEAPIPENYVGRTFLGPRVNRPRDHVFLFRGRMDERYDTVRAVRDKNFRYIRNFSPHRPYGQFYAFPFEVLPSWRSWYNEFRNGNCNDAQSVFWQEKPPEEFFLTTADPFEQKNLANSPAFAAKRDQLRESLRNDILASRDAGFIPEGMATRIAETQTIYDFAQSEKYPLERILDLAELASERNPANLPKFIEALKDSNAIIRYWAATGCLILKGRAIPAEDILLKRLRDPSLDVRVIAAESVAHLGHSGAALKTLEVIAQNTGNTYEAVSAMNSIDYMRIEDLISLQTEQDIIQKLQK